jgi:hypothetical protein
MTDASIEELEVFARYRCRWSSGPQARGASKVLTLAESCGTAAEILSVLSQDEPGDVRDAAIDFVQQFRVPVRDEYVDSVLAVQRLREARLAVDSETLTLADAASIKEICLAALISEAEIRDTVRRARRPVRAGPAAGGGGHAGPYAGRHPQPGRRRWRPRGLW